MKNRIAPVVLTVVLLGVCAFGYKSICASQSKGEEVTKYAECIREQSEERGWIIRSECSSSYYIYDDMAGLEYEQRGYDLYLKR